MPALHGSQGGDGSDHCNRFSQVGPPAKLECSDTAIPELDQNQGWGAECDLAHTSGFLCSQWHSASTSSLCFGYQTHACHCNTGLMIGISTVQPTQVLQLVLPALCLRSLSQHCLTSHVLCRVLPVAPRSGRPASGPCDGEMPAIHALHFHCLSVPGSVLECGQRKTRCYCFLEWWSQGGKVFRQTQGTPDQWLSSGVAGGSPP